MAISTSMYAQLEPATYTSPVNSMTKILALNGEKQDQELQKMKMDEYSRGLNEENQIRELTKQSGGDTSRLRGLLYDSGFMQKGLEIDKNIAAQSKLNFDSKKSEYESQKSMIEQNLKKFELTGQIMSGVSDQKTYDNARMQASEIFGKDAASKLPAEYNPAFIEENKAKALSVKDQMEQAYKKLTLQESQRHNLAGEQNQRFAQQVVMRGQDMGNDRARDLGEMTDSRVRDSNEFARQNMLINRENSLQNKKDAVLSKDVTRLTTAIQKEGVPEMENAVSVAEAALNRYKPGEVPGVGPLKNAMPAFMMSDEGKDVRQSLAQVRNIILSARSGAAVTDQELRRLVEEIGTGVGMSDTDIRRGLEKIRARLEAIKTNIAAGVSDEVLSVYKEQGGLDIQRPRRSPGQPQAAGSASTPQSGGQAGGQPSMQAMEAEMRRRGLLK